MKYSDSALAKKYSKIPEYPKINRSAVKEMHRQVGDLQIDPNGIANRGLIIRHLILPNNLSGTEDIIHFLANEISPNTYLNLMDQYRPTYLANKFPEINRQITTEEYQTTIEFARKSGLTNLDLS